MTTAAPNYLIFLDTETTGLDPNDGSLLELAVVITNEKFDTIWAYNDVFSFNLNENGTSIDPYVLEMHEKNNLWADCAESDIHPEDAEEEILDQLGGLGIPIKTQPPVGNSIHFDREWLYVHMPDLEGYFHYRNIDVSTFTQFTERYMPDVFAGRPTFNKNHRAMADVYDSIETLKYYHRRLRYL